MKIAVIGVLMSASILAGCHRDNVKAPIGAGPDTVRRDQWAQIELEPALAGYVVANQPIVENGDVMKVQVPVRLLSDQGEFARVQYQYTFFDEAGRTLRDQMGWQYVRLEPRTPTFLSGNSTDRAHDWRLVIRMSR